MTSAPRAPLRLLALVIATLVLATGCGQEKSVDLNGTVVDPPFTVASDELTTTDGTPYSLSRDTNAPLTLVFFGYTGCPDTCPAVLSSITSGLLKLTEAQRDQVDVVFVTSDPARDTPKVLRTYLDRFDRNIIGLSGEVDTVAKVGESVGVFVDSGEELPDGGYDPNSHGSYVIGINDDHEAPIFWSGDTAPSQFADDVRFLLTKKPEKLKAGQPTG